MRIFIFLACGINNMVLADESLANMDLRGFKNQIPFANETLSAAKEVFRVLNKVGLKGLANALFSMKQGRQISALKSVAIAAGITGGYFESIDANTANNIYKDVDAFMERNATIYASEYNQKNFQADVDRIMAAYQAMKQYRADRYLFDEEQFLLAYKNSEVDWIFGSTMAEIYLKDVTRQSKYDMDKINEARGALALRYFQAYIAQYFWAGIPYKGNFGSKVKDVNWDFEFYSSSLPRVFKEIDSFYRESYFSGFVKEGFIIPAIDSEQSGGKISNKYSSNNCKIANNIVTKMHEKFPQRNYAAIVSDNATIKSDFLYFNKTEFVLEENYSGKTVMVFMISKNFTEKYDKYREENVHERILNQQLDSGNHLDTLLDYAKYGKRDVQMAVFDDRVAPCFAKDENNTADDFTFEKNGLKAGVYVIF